MLVIRNLLVVMCFVQVVAGGKWWCMVSGSGW